MPPPPRDMLPPREEDMLEDPRELEERARLALCEPP
jgi:hypothetical protein